MLQNQRLAIWDILDWLVKLVKKLMLQNQRQALGTLEGLVKLVKLASTLMLQNQRQALGTLDGTCKTCKHIHATKSKACTLGLWMGFVKLVKHVNTFMLQNQRSTKHLYRIDSNTNLYRIILGGFNSTSDIFWFVLMLSHVRFLIL